MSDMAIKYAMKKKAKKCMADGGDVDMVEETPSEHAKKMADGMKKAFNYAEGGAVDNEDDADMITRIMHKRKAYSKGGEVANDTPAIADEEPNDFDELALDDDLSFHETGKNSGDELGDEAEDEDEKDIVSKIMKSRKKKDHMPRPA